MQGAVLSYIQLIITNAKNCIEDCPSCMKQSDRFTSWYHYKNLWEKNIIYILYTQQANTSIVNEKIVAQINS